ncbi:unnamed protein product, partial [Closterium sp. NIES-53]
AEHTPHPHHGRDLPSSHRDHQGGQASSPANDDARGSHAGVATTPAPRVVRESEGASDGGLETEGAAAVPPGLPAEPQARTGHLPPPVPKWGTAASGGGHRLRRRTNGWGRLSGDNGGRRCSRYGEGQKQPDQRQAQRAQTLAAQQGESGEQQPEPERAFGEVEGGGRKPAAPVARETVAPVAREPVAPVAREPVAPVARESVARLPLLLAAEPVTPVARVPVAPVASVPVAPVARVPVAPVAPCASSFSCRPLSPLLS